MPEKEFSCGEKVLFLPADYPFSGYKALTIVIKLIAPITSGTQPTKTASGTEKICHSMNGILVYLHSWPKRFSPSVTSKAEYTVMISDTIVVFLGNRMSCVTGIPCARNMIASQINVIDENVKNKLYPKSQFK